MTPRALLTISLTLPPLALAACASSTTGGRPVQDDHSITKTSTSGALDGRPTLGMPIGIPGEHTVIIPFSIETKKGWFEPEDPYAQARRRANLYPSDVSPWQPSGWHAGARWHNAIIADLESGERWAILQSRGVINRYEVLIHATPQPITHKSVGIVFIATTTDGNGDGMLDARDPMVAILTDADGRNPRTITPADAQVWGISHDDANGRAAFYVVPDTDKDGAYTTEDEGEPWVISLSQASGQAVPIIDAALRARLLELVR